MYWLREWIWQIAGIIILSAVCDMIVPGGEMKKYVRLVMGLIMVVAVIRPLVNVPAISLTEFENSQAGRNAAELKNVLDEREMFNVIKIYKQKLCRKIENELEVSLDVKADVKVELEVDNDEEFGNVTGVTVLMHDESGEKNTSGVQRKVADSIGIGTDKVKIVVLSGDSCQQNRRE